MTTIEVPSTSPEDQASSLTKVLTRDFYLSFKFSQGSSGAQLTLEHALIGYYAKNWSESDKQWLRDNSNTLLGYFTRLSPPKSHSRILTMDVVSDAANSNNNANSRPVYRDFLEEGILFIDAIKFFDPITMNRADSVAPKNAAVRAICFNLIDSDRIYQAENMPRYYQAADDPHRSYFRDYVLLSKPTGSDAFDQIFHEANEFFRSGDSDNGIVDQIEKLTQEWQAIHPGQVFFPVSL